MIETSGMWIGIVDDVSNYMEVEHFEIKKNDSILLFTDRITEAWEINQLKKLGKGFLMD